MRPAEECPQFLSADRRVDVVSANVHLEQELVARERVRRISKQGILNTRNRSGLRGFPPMRGCAVRRYRDERIEIVCGHSAALCMLGGDTGREEATSLLGALTSCAFKRLRNQGSIRRPLDWCSMNILIPDIPTIQLRREPWVALPGSCHPLRAEASKLARSATPVTSGANPKRLLIPSAWLQLSSRAGWGQVRWEDDHVQDFREPVA